MAQGSGNDFLLSLGIALALSSNDKNAITQYLNGLVNKKIVVPVGISKSDLKRQMKEMADISQQSVKPTQPLPAPRAYQQSSNSLYRVDYGGQKYKVPVNKSTGETGTPVTSHGQAITDKYLASQVKMQADLSRGVANLHYLRELPAIRSLLQKGGVVNSQQQAQQQAKIQAQQQAQLQIQQAKLQAQQQAQLQIQQAKLQAQQQAQQAKLQMQQQAQQAQQAQLQVKIQAQQQAQQAKIQAQQQSQQVKIQAQQQAQQAKQQAQQQAQQAKQQAQQQAQQANTLPLGLGSNGGVNTSRYSQLISKVMREKAEIAYKDPTVEQFKNYNLAYQKARRVITSTALPIPTVASYGYRGVRDPMAINPAVGGPFSQIEKLHAFSNAYKQARETVAVLDQKIAKAKNDLPLITPEFNRLTGKESKKQALLQTTQNDITAKKAQIVANTNAAIGPVLKQELDGLINKYNKIAQTAQDRPQRISDLSAQITKLSRVLASSPPVRANAYLDMVKWMTRVQMTAANPSLFGARSQESISGVFESAHGKDWRQIISARYGIGLNQLGSGKNISNDYKTLFKLLDVLSSNAYVSTGKVKDLSPDMQNLMKRMQLERELLNRHVKWTPQELLAAPSDVREQRLKGSPVTRAALGVYQWASTKAQSQGISNIDQSGGGIVGGIGRTAMGVANIGLSFSRYTQEILGGNSALKEHANLFGVAMGRVIRWGAAATLIYRVTGYITKLNKEMIGLERSITNVVATYQSPFVSQEMVTRRVMDVSKKYGAKPAETADSMKYFAQAGYGMEQSTQMTEAVLLTNATQSFSSGQEASKAVIGIIKQFNLDASQSIGILSALVSVEKKHAITAKDLGDGLSKIGSISNMVNISYEESIGLVTALGSASQKSGAETGNALKALMTRIYQPRTKKALLAQGFDVEKTGGEEYKSYTELLTEINSKWAGMSQKQRVDLSATMADRRRMNDFMMLMDSYAESQQATAEAAAGTSEAMQAQALIMDTVSKKFEVAKVNLTDFMMGLGENGLLGMLRTTASAASGLTTALAGVARNKITGTVMSGALTAGGLAAMFKASTMMFGGQMNFLPPGGIGSLFSSSRFNKFVDTQVQTHARSLPIYTTAMERAAESRSLPTGDPQKAILLAQSRSMYAAAGQSARQDIVPGLQAQRAQSMVLMGGLALAALFTMAASFFDKRKRPDVETVKGNALLSQSQETVSDYQQKIAGYGNRTKAMAMLYSQVNTNAEKLNASLRKIGDTSQDSGDKSVNAMMGTRKSIREATEAASAMATSIATLQKLYADMGELVTSKDIMAASGTPEQSEKLFKQSMEARQKLARYMGAKGAEIAGTGGAGLEEPNSKAYNGMVGAGAGAGIGVPLALLFAAGIANAWNPLGWGALGVGAAMVGGSALIGGAAGVGYGQYKQSEHSQTNDRIKEYMKTDDSVRDAMAKQSTKLRSEQDTASAAQDFDTITKTKERLDKLGSSVSEQISMMSADYLAIDDAKFIDEDSKKSLKKAIEEKAKKLMQATKFVVDDKGKAADVSFLPDDKLDVMTTGKSQYLFSLRKYQQEMMDVEAEMVDLASMTESMSRTAKNVSDNLAFTKESFGIFNKIFSGMGGFNSRYKSGESDLSRNLAQSGAQQLTGNPQATSIMPNIGKNADLFMRDVPNLVQSIGGLDTFLNQMQNFVTNPQAKGSLTYEDASKKINEFINKIPDFSGRKTGIAGMDALMANTPGMKEMMRNSAMALIKPLQGGTAISPEDAAKAQDAFSKATQSYKDSAMGIIKVISEQTDLEFDHAKKLQEKIKTELDMALSQIRIAQQIEQAFQSFFDTITGVIKSQASVAAQYVSPMEGSNIMARSSQRMLNMDLQNMARVAAIPGTMTSGQDFIMNSGTVGSGLAGTSSLLGSLQSQAMSINPANKDESARVTQSMKKLIEERGGVVKNQVSGLSDEYSGVIRGIIDQAKNLVDSFNPANLNTFVNQLEAMNGVVQQKSQQSQQLTQKMMQSYQETFNNVSKSFLSMIDRAGIGGVDAGQFKQSTQSIVQMQKLFGVGVGDVFASHFNPLKQAQDDAAKNLVKTSILSDLSPGPGSTVGNDMAQRLKQATDQSISQNLEMAAEIIRMTPEAQKTYKDAKEAELTWEPNINTNDTNKYNSVVNEGVTGNTGVNAQRYDIQKQIDKARLDAQAKIEESNKIEGELVADKNDQYSTYQTAQRHKADEIKYQEQQIAGLKSGRLDSKNFMQSIGNDPASSALFSSAGITYGGKPNDPVDAENKINAWLNKKSTKERYIPEYLESVKNGALKKISDYNKTGAEISSKQATLDSMKSTNNKFVTTQDSQIEAQQKYREQVKKDLAAKEKELDQSMPSEVQQSTTLDERIQIAKDYGRSKYYHIPASNSYTGYNPKTGRVEEMKGQEAYDAERSNPKVVASEERNGIADYLGQLEDKKQWLTALIDPKQNKEQQDKWLNMPEFSQYKKYTDPKERQAAIQADIDRINGEQKNVSDKTGVTDKLAYNDRIRMEEERTNKENQLAEERKQSYNAEIESKKQKAREWAQYAMRVQEQLNIEMERRAQVRKDIFTPLNELKKRRAAEAKLMQIDAASMPYYLQKHQDMAQYANDANFQKKWMRRHAGETDRDGNTVTSEDQDARWYARAADFAGITSGAMRDELQGFIKDFANILNNSSIRTEPIKIYAPEEPIKVAATLSADETLLNALKRSASDNTELMNMMRDIGKNQDLITLVATSVENVIRQPFADAASDLDGVSVTLNRTEATVNGVAAKMGVPAAQNQQTTSPPANKRP